MHFFHQGFLKEIGYIGVWVACVYVETVNIYMLEMDYYSCSFQSKIGFFFSNKCMSYIKKFSHKKNIDISGS